MSKYAFAVVVALAFSVTACKKDPQKLKAEFVQSGDRYMSQKNYREAIIQYRNAIGVDAADGEARLKAGHAYESAGEVLDALREYIRAADLLPGSVEAQLAAGRMLLVARQYPEARARATVALQKDPKSVGALILLGNSLAGLNDMTAAIAQVEEAIAAEPSRTLSYTNLGMLQLAQGNKVAAEDALKRAVEVSPRSVDAHLALANYHWALGENAEAEREMRSAISFEPGSAEANQSLAAFLTATGRDAEAGPFLKAYADAADSSGPQFVLADYYIRNRQAAAAVEVLNKLSAAKESFAQAQLRLAFVDFTNGRIELSYSKLDGILQKEPNNEGALVFKARVLLSEGKTADALRLSEAVIKANPKSVPGHLVRAVALESANSTAEAIDAYKEILRLRPGAMIALVRLANLQLNQGDSNAVAELLGETVKNQPDAALPRLLRAKALVQLGNFPAAEADLLFLSGSGQNSSDVQTALGDLYSAKGDIAKARASYERAVEATPHAVGALVGLVRIDLAQKKNSAARSRVELALKQAPDDVQLLALAGRTFAATGDRAQAEATFRRILELDAANMDAYASLSLLLLEEQRLDEAKAEYEAAAKGQPRAAVVSATMIGTILTLQGKHDEAREQYKKALELDPRAAVAANNLAWDYAERGGGNIDVALGLAQMAKSRLPNNWEVSDTLGWIYLKKGLASLAIAAFRQGVEQNPSTPVVHYHLGLAYLKNGDRANAKLELERALKIDTEVRMGR